MLLAVDAVLDVLPNYAAVECNVLRVTKHRPYHAYTTRISMADPPDANARSDVMAQRDGCRPQAAPAAEPIGNAAGLRGIRLIVFDFGGVLRDNSVSINEGIRAGFESEGIAYPYEVQDLWRFRGIGKFDVAIECIKVLLALALRGESDRLRTIINDASAEEILDEIASSSLDVSLLAMAERIRLRYKQFTDSPEAGRLISIYPYVKKALDAISNKGYLVALLTNGSRLMVERDLPFPEKFSAIITEDDVTHKKPSNEGLQLIIERLGCKASETVYVCDAGNDIIAGRRAGVRCVAVLAGMGTREQLLRYNLDLIVDDVEQLGRLLPLAASISMGVAP